MDSHLKRIPSLGTFTARRLSGGDLEGLSRETDGALDAEVLGLGALDELLAHLLKRGDLPAGEGDADLMSFLKSRHLVSGDKQGPKIHDRNTDRAFAEVFLGFLVRHDDSFTTRTVSYGKVMKVIAEIVGVRLSMRK